MSEIDPETERVIQEALARESRNVAYRKAVRKGGTAAMTASGVLLGSNALFELANPQDNSFGNGALIAMALGSAAGILRISMELRSAASFTSDPFEQ